MGSHFSKYGTISPYLKSLSFEIPTDPCGGYSLVLVLCGVLCNIEIPGEKSSVGTFIVCRTLVCTNGTCSKEPCWQQTTASSSRVVSWVGVPRTRYTPTRWYTILRSTSKAAAALQAVGCGIVSLSFPLLSTSLSREGGPARVCLLPNCYCCMKLSGYECE